MAGPTLIVSNTFYTISKFLYLATLSPILFWLVTQYFSNSVNVTDLVCQHFILLDANGNHKEDIIYDFYYDVLQLGGDTREWAKFAVFCLILATGNAISERGFSAMANVHTKLRSELGLDHVFGGMLAAFNGPSLSTLARSTVAVQ